MVGTQKRAFLIVQVLLFGALLGLGYGLIVLNDFTNSLAEQVQTKFTQKDARLDAFSALLNDRERGKRSADGRDPEQTVDWEEFTRTVVKRLDSIEQEIADLWVLRGEEHHGAALSSGRGADEAGADSNGQVSELPPSVAMTYAEETGRSDWGESSAENIRQAFTYKPYFSKYGGDLAADCRQTTCWVEWAMPRPDSLPPAESEDMLAMAEYELLALAAENSEQVGRIDTKWTMENGQPKVTLFLRRTEQVQEEE